MSFAKGILQHNHIRFLMRINNEAKVRRLIKSVVLGTAKIMGYEGLVEARVRRDKKDAAKEAKGKEKRGRKRKSVVLETEASQAEAIEPMAKKTRRSKALEQPWSVPVARMY
ncbi:hypothetical protein P154DRAFT_574005 [Amniculicola lignicola CBS 123094]|uniref:Uncharacterized protein n=1 Tax=Amniculicola lignicola CBS 123094 TaxID=1392246 RepID=A0A6A5WNG2_9PLEO|nr:hypothetical protein P154DRAFT_574005 [Amniculicola lignicola CBS 123094]